MINTIRTLVAAVVIAALSLGQELTVTISPNPAPLGTNIVITAQATIPNLYTPVGCLLADIHVGTPTGPSCALFGCTFLPSAIPVYGSPTFRQYTWNQGVLSSVIPGGMATPGVYYLEIRHQVGGGFGAPSTAEFFPVTIDNPANPTPGSCGPEHAELRLDLPDEPRGRHPARWRAVRRRAVIHVEHGNPDSRRPRGPRQ